MTASNSANAGQLVTGRIGTRQSDEALARLAEGAGALTLSVCAGDGEREKVIHLEDGRWRVFPARSSGESGSSPLGNALTECFSWTGAWFELAAGVKAESFAAWTDGHEGDVDRDELRRLAQSLSVDAAEEAGPGGATTETLASLHGLTSRVRSRRLVWAELARLHERLGSRERASQCWQEVAREWQVWSLPEAALHTLERAAETFPANLDVLWDLIAASVATGEPRRGEAALSRAAHALPASYLAPRLVGLCSLLGAAVKDPELLSRWGEAEIQDGKAQDGANRIAEAAAGALARGDAAAAERLYGRAAGFLPAACGPGRRARELRRRRLLTRELPRWGASIAAAVVLLAWILLDVRSASALESLREAGKSRDPRQAIAQLRKEAEDLTSGSHVERVLQIEGEYLDSVLEEEKAELAAAMDLYRQNELTAAAEGFRRLAAKSLFPLLAGRATALARTAEARHDARAARLTEASSRMARREWETAFTILQAALKDGIEARLAANLVIPIRVETVPRGARLSLAGQDPVLSPAWLLAPVDANVALEATLPGFQPLVALGPAWTCIRQESSTLRLALAPDSVAELVEGGGEIAAGIDSDATLVPILGADAVLRGLSSGRKLRWQLPPDAAWSMMGRPVVYGKTVIAGTRQGLVLGVSASRGTLQWETFLGKGAHGVRVGPIHKSSVLVSSEAGALLLGAESGQLVRQLDVEEGPARLQAVSGDIGVFWIGDGDWIGCDLETGQRRFEVRRRFAGATAVVVSGDTVVSLQPKGTITAFTLDGKSQKWRRSFPSAVSIDRMGEKGAIVVGSADGVVESLRLDSGEPLWRCKVPGAVTGFSAPSPGEASRVMVHVERQGKRVFAAVRIRDGALLWEVTRGVAEAAWAHSDSRRVVLSTPSTGVLVLRPPSDS